MLETDLVMDLIEILEGLRRYQCWYGNQSLPIRHNEMMLLLFLNHNLRPDHLGIQPSKLGKILRLTRPTITSLVNSLEEQGYVARVNDDEDRRAVFVCLTAKGQKLVDENRKEFFRNISEIMEFLGEKDAQELIRLMGRIRVFLKKKRAGLDGRTVECGD
ncbi:MAG: winged helix-turn-helix transcriptional regulator [Firmicutes bacterium]|nr:winged helix-turn-helix transcriptional regulator [Bacillota bacterium]